MTSKTLEEINEEYEGFKITGRIEYNGTSREVLCRLTAQRKGFEPISKSGYRYETVLGNLYSEIDKTLYRISLEKKAKRFLLMPIDADVASGITCDLALFAKTRAGWVPLDNSDEVLTERDGVWELYNALYVPIPTEHKELTRKQELQLLKLQQKVLKNTVEFVTQRVQEILEK